MQQLYIAGNGLKGNLNYFEMVNLKILNANTNKFTGSLSSNISNLSFEVFDISSNQITGYFSTNFDPQKNHNRNTIYAHINRFSGLVNDKLIDMYENVQVLSGNSISCSTLPKADSVYVQSSFFSECETRPVFFSIIIWCISFGLCLLACVIKIKGSAKVAVILFKKYISFDTQSIQMQFPKAFQLIWSLKKLQKLVLISSMCVITLLVAIYSGFEFSENANTQYKVLFEKYNYAISGIFLKSVPPAVVLLIVFMGTSMSFVYITHSTFLLDWLHSMISLRTDIVSNSREIRYVLLRYFLLIGFLSISLAMNVAFVYGLSAVSESVLPLQVGFSICNYFYRFHGCNMFLSYLSKSFFLTKIESVWFHASIMLFSGIINPCLATLVIDSNCFRDYVFNRPAINSSYSIEYCAVVDITAGAGSCASLGVYQVQSTFTPPFLYGHRCRDAVFGNYIPVIFLSCAFNTFVYPFLYIFSTTGIQNLNSQMILFSFSFNSKRIVLGHDLVQHVEGIISDLVLMILFGIAYPLCFLFLLVDVSSRIYLLILRIHLYAQLHQANMNKNIEIDNENIQYLENMVSDVALSAPYLMWPGLGVASVIFGLYLFDIAWDTTDNNLVAPITLLLLNLFFFSIICAVYFQRKAKIGAFLEARMDILQRNSSIINVEIQNIPETNLSGVKKYGVELQVAGNPIHDVCKDINT